MNATQEERLKAFIESTHFSRGRYLHAFSQVEFILLNVIQKIKDQISYVDFDIKFQSSLNGRIRLIRKLYKADGPLKGFNKELEFACNKLEDYSTIRQFLAHGLGEVEFSENKIQVIFRRYDPKKSNTWEPEFLVFKNNEFVETTNIICDELNICLIKLRDIYDRLNLEGNSPIGEFRTL